jgi:hypothetical protein
MTVQELASTPPFALSLAFCALVAAYAVTVALKYAFQRASKVAAFRGLSQNEVQSIEYAADFHESLGQLIEHVLLVETFSQEAPEVFVDNSWSRLLKMCDDLEECRGELNYLLGERDFDSAVQLGRFLSGRSPTLPNYERDPEAVKLHPLCYWQRDSIDLLHRMISKIEDVGREFDADLNPRSKWSSDLQETIEQVKTYIDESEHS